MSRAAPSFLIALLGASLVTVAAAGARADDAAPSFQSDGRDVVATDRTVDIRSLHLDLTLDVLGGRVHGTATHTLTFLRSGLRELRLHAVGLGVEGITIDGQPTTFRVLSDQIAVALPGASTVNVPHVLAITYAAQPDMGLHFRRPGAESPDTYDEVWSQGEDTDNRHWFPTWDAPDDRFVYTGRFSALDRFTVVSNGRLTEKGPTPGAPGWTSWTYALQDQDLVSYLVMVAAAEYDALGGEWRGRPLLNFYPPDVDEASVRRATARTPEMLDFMSSATGVEYPYPGYSHVFVQRFIYSGMENTTATVLTRRLLYPEREAEHARPRTESVLAHELAHQWFGDQLTLRDWSHMWLNEGITTFLEGWWQQYAHGPELYSDRVFGRYRSVIGADNKDPRPLVVTFLSRTDDRINNHVYTKGASVMQMLRVLLGEEDFGRAFRRYCRERQHTNVDTGDLQRIFEDETGLKLDWFFQQWVYLAGHPRLEVEHAIDAEQGTVRVAVKQTQAVGGLVPLFVLPVDLDIATDQGVSRTRLWLDGTESASVVLPLAGTLAWVAVDPDGGLLAEIAQEQTDAEWSALLAQTGSAYARRAALHAVGERKGPASVELRAAVEGILADEQANPLWRRLAAGTLGAWKDATSRGTLVAALQGAPGIESDVRLQEAILDALAGGERDAAVVAAMRTAWSRGTTDTVRASGLQGLARLVQSEALPDLRRALGGGAGHNGVVHQVAIESIGEHGDGRDIGRLARFRAPSVAHGLRSAALRASARIANRQLTADARKAARKPVARDAEANLSDLNLRGLQVTVGVLGTVGDAASIPPLQALQKRSMVPALHKQIEQAVQAIRTRTDTDPEPANGALTARLKKLEEQLDALDTKLETLEERR